MKYTKPVDCHPQIISNSNCVHLFKFEPLKLNFTFTFTFSLNGINVNTNGANIDLDQCFPNWATERGLQMGFNL